MFWDKAAKFYDLFEKVYNGKVYKKLGAVAAQSVGKDDSVLECACGTGAISKIVANACKKLTATDLSEEMLKRARKKCKKLSNVEFAVADILHLDYEDNSFDKVIAGNVIHLLDDPIGALRELERVCRPGGKLIIPTYINMLKNGKTGFFVSKIDKAGASMKRHFTYESYKEFFTEAGYSEVEFGLIEGKMPCAVAVITKTGECAEAVTNEQTE
ncbi:MAG: methyltransferase domain-containing protein [Clostridiales bacterium]|nr:methyltransferase domain-containing protein [Clostridiales bacterium]